MPCAVPSPMRFIRAVFTTFLAGFVLDTKERRGLALLQLQVDKLRLANSATLFRVGEASGDTAGLTEEGYSKVAALRSEADMKAFIHRVLRADGKTVLNEGSLNGILSYYDGIEAEQSLEALRNELAHADWVYPPYTAVSGNLTDLTDNGYLQVAALKNAEEMKAFVRRILSADGRSVLNEGALDGMIPFYDGTNGTQSLQALRHELAAAKWVDPGFGRTVDLSEDGYQKVVALHDDLQMKSFARHILNESRAGGPGLDESKDEQKLDDSRLEQILDYFNGKFDIQDFETLQKELQSNVEVHGLSGRTALFTPEEYEQVVSMNNDTEMESYVRRLLHLQGGFVKNQSGLDEFILSYSRGWHDGFKPLWNLRTALRQASWVNPGLGATAPLSEEGYQRVADLRSHVQMRAFAQRILREHGKPLMEKADIDKLIPFFDGWISIQDKESLTAALLQNEADSSEDWDYLDESDTWATSEQSQTTAITENKALLLALQSLSRISLD